MRWSLRLSCVALGVASVGAIKFEDQGYTETYVLAPPESPNPLDPVISGLADGRLGGQGTPLDGLIPASIAGMPIPPLSTIMNMTNRMVGMVTNGKLVTSLHTVMDRIEALANRTLDNMNDNIDNVSRSCGAANTTETQAVAEVTHFFHNAVVVFTGLAHDIANLLNAEVVPKLGSELQGLAIPAFAAAHGVIMGISKVADDKFDRFGSLSTEGLCEQVEPFMNSKRGVPMVEAKLKEQLPNLRKLKEQVPNMIPYLTMANPAIAPSVAHLMVRFFDMWSRVGEDIQAGCANFDVKVGRVVTERLRCEYNDVNGGKHKRKHRSSHIDDEDQSGAAPSAPFSRVFMVFLSGLALSTL